MTVAEPLDRAIVEAFKTAMGSGRSDVAEHLLCALECLGRGSESGSANEAYKFINTESDRSCRKSHCRRKRAR